MTSDEIRISAEPQSDTACQFTVDRPVYPDAAFYIDTPEKAKGSPLASKLFEIEGVASVLIAHEQITVNIGGMGDWRQIGPQVGAAIREHLASGSEAVSDELRQSLPPTEEIREKVQQVLTSEINPNVASHGGVVELIDVRDNNVFVKMGGGCQGCGMAKMTLKHGVETAIRRAVPEVGTILDTTDHASGRNPYYSASG